MLAQTLFESFTTLLGPLAFVVVVFVLAYFGFRIGQTARA